MVNLDKLMRLHAASSSGKWNISLVPDPEFPGVQIYRLYTGRRFLGEIDTHFPGDPEAHYSVAACNAVPGLVARIRELEAERDWLAQAAANAGWYGVRVGKDYMIDQARIAVSRAQAEQHECPTPEVSCHARDGKLCMSNNHLACAQAADEDSFIMRQSTEVK